jgi:hypothetical protein
MLPVTSTETPAGAPDYHWTPANQRAFLEHLAISGVAAHAAKAVSMSANSAYRLRIRSDGLAFNIGWEAALMVARGRLIDTLMERAIEGYDETATRSEDGREITRFKYDSRLAMAMVHRFDKRIDGPGEALPASLLAFARIAAQDFEAYLDLVEKGAAAAQLSLFLAARSDLAALLTGNNLPQISADFEEEDECEVAPVRAAQDAARTPEEEAAEMEVWFCEDNGTWRTNFPPPDGFFGDEQGEFGNDDYERELSDEEEEVRLARAEEDIAPLRAAGEAARRAWFGLPEPPAELTQRRRDAEEEGAELLASHEAGPMDDLTMAAMTARDLTDAAAESAEEEGATSLRPPPEDPTIRVIHCEPPFNYPAHGMIPPWAERIY